MGKTVAEKPDIMLKKRNIYYKRMYASRIWRHFYIKEQIIIEKIKQNKVTNEEMKNPLI